MFTTDSGFGTCPLMRRLHSVHHKGREVSLTSRGLEGLVSRLVNGQNQETAVHEIMHIDRDFSYEVIGWWVWNGEDNPYREIGRVQICRGMEYGKTYFTATSMVCDHSSTTLGHLLGRLTRMQHGAAKRRREEQEQEEQEDMYDEYDDDLIDGVGFADPGGRSALRAETESNPRDQPCPTCGRKNVLTRIDRAKGYQCNVCADRAEGRMGGDY